MSAAGVTVPYEGGGEISGVLISNSVLEVVIQRARWEANFEPIKDGMKTGENKRVRMVSEVTNNTTKKSNSNRVYTGQIHRCPLKNIITKKSRKIRKSLLKKHSRLIWFQICTPDDCG